MAARDWAEAAIQARVEGIRSALQRTRVAFLATVIAASAIVIAGWNAYSPAAREFLGGTQLSGNDFAAEIQKQRIQQTFSGRVVSVGLLGIHVRVEDFRFIGSAAMLVCSIWVLVGLRGLQRNVVQLKSLLEANADDGPRLYARHAVDSMLVFLEHRQSLPVRVLAAALWFVPLAAIVAILLMDLLGEQAGAAAEWFVALCGAATSATCYLAHRSDTGTSAVLAAFPAPRPPQPPPPAAPSDAKTGR